jgi:glycosyltransferase involved in cell wall biosynthesis
MMAQNIRNLIENPHELEVFKQNAKKTAIDRFDLDKMIEKTYNLYKLRTNQYMQSE